MKQVLCAFIGTSLALIMAGFIAEQWIDSKVRQVQSAVHQSISDVANAPANALQGLYDTISNF